MKKTVIWLDNYLEEFFMVISLILMTVIMGIQVFSRYVLGSAPSWSEEITRYLFVWSGFLSVSYAQKMYFPLRSNSLCQFSHEEEGTF
ncbi:MAG: TRAP transporter small permease [Coprococcus sp.]